MTNVSQRGEESRAPAASQAAQYRSAEANPARRLQGHSGAMVLLYEQRPDGIVRKVAADHSRNERLQRQSALQRRLSSCGIPFPRVLAEGIDEDGVAFFDMEYVPAHDLASLIREAVYFDERVVLSTLDRVLRFFYLTQGDVLPARPFHEKIDQIATRSGALAACAPYGTKIAAMAARLNGLQWDGVPSSLCHGDLTMENMLYSRARGLVFVDCDDCFVSSYWLDAAKIFQDVTGRWCLRDLYLTGSRETDAAARRLDALAQALRAMLALLDRELVIRLPQFVALNLFRTLPYAKGERLVRFVLERTSSVLDGAGL